MFETSIELGAAALAGVFLRELYARFRGTERKQSQFVTITECTRQRAQCPSSQTTHDLETFKKEMRDTLSLIKGLLLAIAIKSGVPLKDYEGLVK